ncbi:MAG: ATP-binding protein [Pseudomonadota bacterium]
MNFAPITHDKLKSLHLNAISTFIETHQHDGKWDKQIIETWLNEVLDIQLAENQAKMFARLLKAAKLRWPNATFASSESLNMLIEKTVLDYLKSCEWLRNSTHILLSGKSSSGKTHIACALGNEAILKGFRVQFFRFKELLIQLRAADNEDALVAFIKKLLRIDLLIIDDWTIDKLPRQEQAVLFELVEKREKRGSFVITTQFDPSAIHEAIGGDAVADAILSRIVPLSQRINLEHDIDFRKQSMTKPLTKKESGDV